MTEDFLKYDQLVEDALKGVVRTALRLVQKHGLPDTHHFYITFRTNHSDVIMPPYLREKYPDEMTIVLQYQFDNLEVTETHFSLSLSFNNIQETLQIPFQAVVGFADPSVKFGLQFHGEEYLDEEELRELEEADILSLDEFNHLEIQQDTPPAAKAETAKEKNSTETGKVIKLDSFRKKK